MTLAKSVIEDIPTYPMMKILILKQCIDEIHCIERRFIWGDTEQILIYHVVGWDTISIPQKNGGFGIRRMKEINEACILKIGTNLQVGTKDLWYEVLKGKYNCDNTTTVIEAKVTNSHICKSVVKSWPLIQ